ncbi:MAG TPA: DUF1080 domain-containing protein [Candidatus Acidoferrales bacterium]|nr:DUF1080 domain-containing protein [Candidatus Acidoferrales bacterium]
MKPSPASAVVMHQFRIIPFALILFAAPAIFAADWIHLFNGKDLSGWTQKGGPAKFYVRDGCLVGEAVSESETNSVLCTKKDYRNFILELDFKVDRLLFSGVQIRSRYAAKRVDWKWDGRPLTIPAGHVYGYLVLIDPSPIHRWWTATLFDERWWTGGIYDEKRRMWLYPGPEGGDPDEFSSQGMKIFRTNDWNHLRIEAVGDSMETFLNGVPCAQIHDAMTPKGFIGLQVRNWISDDEHATLAGAKVWFKNIRLKPLPRNLLSTGGSGFNAASTKFP